MTLPQFHATYNQTYVDFDGEFGNQCWDLAAAYALQVIGCPGLPTGPNLAARECYQVFADPLPHYFDKIPPVAPPLPGDIVVWGSAIGPDGHIAICLFNSPGGFTSFDQNWPIGSLAHDVAHNYNGVIGYLRPKGSIVMFDQQDYQAIAPMFTSFGVKPPPAGICVGFPTSAALGALFATPEWSIVKSRALMNKDSLTRLHRLAMGAEPGPAYLQAFDGQVLDPAMKQLEGDPNRLNAKSAPGSTVLAPGNYVVK